MFRRCVVCAGTSTRAKIGVYENGEVCAYLFERFVCDAYLGGIADGEALSYLAAHNNGDKNALEGFCIPSDETTAKMRDKVLTWIKAHKDSLEKPVGESVFTALHESYPCSARQ